MIEPIKFKAIISRVSTDAAGGAKVTLGVPESDMVAAAKLMKMQEMVLDVVIKPEVNDPTMPEEE